MKCSRMLTLAVLTTAVLLGAPAGASAASSSPPYAAAQRPVPGVTVDAIGTGQDLGEGRTTATIRSPSARSSPDRPFASTSDPPGGNLRESGPTPPEHGAPSNHVFPSGVTRSLSI